MTYNTTGVKQQQGFLRKGIKKKVGCSPNTVASTKILQSHGNKFHNKSQLFTRNKNGSSNFLDTC